MTRLGRYLTPAAAALFLLVVLTLVVRVGVIAAMQDNLRQDPDAYRNIADNLTWHRVYGMGHSRNTPPQPTAYRPPLYPLVLAKFASDDGGVVMWRVAAVHVVLALATVWLVWIVAGQMATKNPLPSGEGGSRSEPGEGAPPRNSLSKVIFPFAAGLLVACDPLLLNQSTLVMTETLAAFLTVVCLFALNRFTADRRSWNAGLAGGAISLAVLCRPTYLPWLALVGLTMLLLRPSPKCKVQSPKSDVGHSGWRDWLWRGLNVAALGLIAAVVVSPWAIRNYRVFGKPIVSTTHGGYTFLLANNPEFYQYLQTSNGDQPWDGAQFNKHWREHDDRQAIEEFHAWARKNEKQFRNDSRDFASLFLLHPELRIDELAYGLAIDTIVDDPKTFAWSCLYRVRQLWSPLPHQLTADEPLTTQLARYAVAAWYIAVYLLAAVGIWKLRSKLLAPPWLWGLLLCLVFTGIHTFYWTNLRMRAPLMPFVALLSAYGLAAIWVSWRRRIASQPAQAAS